MMLQTLLATPFKKTGAIYRNPRLQGNVSCEGIVRTPEPVTSPCSGQACIYYEIEIALRTDRGRMVLETIKGGGVFFVDDGSGAVPIDSRQGMEVELDRVFAEAHEHRGGDVGDMYFGRFRYSVPPLHSPGMIEVTEKIVPLAAGNMFVLGKVDNGCMRKPLASRRGRIPFLVSSCRPMGPHIAAGALLVMLMAFVLGVAAREAPPQQQVAQLDRIAPAEVTAVAIPVPAAFVSPVPVVIAPPEVPTPDVKQMSAVFTKSPSRSNRRARRAW